MIRTSHVNNKGYAALVVLFLVTGVGVVMASAIAGAMITKQKMLRAVVASAQSYYVAESGIEDAILRVINPAIPFTLSENLTLAGGTATTILSLVDNIMTITTEGNVNNYIRNVEVSLEPNTVGASFNYGIQVGDGGIEFTKAGARIEGNVYSNGSILGFHNTEITGSATVAGVGGTIDDFYVWGDTYSDIIKDTEVDGTANYNTNSGGNDFNGPTVTPLDPIPLPIDMPIDDTTINNWKSQAEAGGIISGNYTIDNEVVTLGPVKIDGNLTIKGASVVSMLGTVWVTGNIILQNGGVLELDDGYGSDSGIIVADGTITLLNNFVVCGSEGWNEGSPRACNVADDSYIMLLSTAIGENVIGVGNNADMLSAILYAPYGEVELANNIALRAVTAYNVEVINNVEIIYDGGLVNLNFSSGPGGGWGINNWREVE
ncbi:MAG: hypothetical protein Q8O88_03190 [bacterium]|nr:hypothetical protein [bacterium]